jgi:hypothetical protein
MTDGKPTMDDQRFVCNVKKQNTGAATTFLAARPGYLVEHAAWLGERGVDRARVLAAFTRSPHSMSSANPFMTVTDAKRLMSLVSRGVFTPEEAKPLVMRCDDAEAVLTFRTKFPGAVSDEETVASLNIRQVAAAGSTGEGEHPKYRPGQKSRRIRRMSRQIEGVKDAVTVLEVMDA